MAKKLSPIQLAIRARYRPQERALGQQVRASKQRATKELPSWFKEYSQHLGEAQHGTDEAFKDVHTSSGGSAAGSAARSALESSFGANLKGQQAAHDNYYGVRGGNAVRQLVDQRLRESRRGDNYKLALGDLKGEKAAYGQDLKAKANETAFKNSVALQKLSLQERSTESLIQNRAAGQKIARGRLRETTSHNEFMEEAKRDGLSLQQANAKWDHHQDRIKSMREGERIDIAREGLTLKKKNAADKAKGKGVKPSQTQLSTLQRVQDIPTLINKYSAKGVTSTDIRRLLSNPKSTKVTTTNGLTVYGLGYSPTEVNAAYDVYARGFLSRTNLTRLKRLGIPIPKEWTRTAKPVAGVR